MNIPPYIFNIYEDYGLWPLLVLAVFGTIFYMFILLPFKEGFLKPFGKKLGTKYANRFSKKPLDTIHVFIPLTGGARGDALMQAAGFLKAAEDFKNLKIVFHDTEYDAERAVSKMQNIMNEWKKGDAPLAMVATMSHTCMRIAEEAKILLNKKEYKNLRKSFSMIFTVASASRVPHIPELNIYKYTVSGDKEVIFIKELLRGTDNTFSIQEPILLCSTNSDYPTSAIAELTRKIIKHQDTPPFMVLPFDENGALANCSFSDLKSYNQAIVFGYDNYLFNIFKFLIDKGFAGKVLCPTTFSVKDWQQIWKGKEEEIKKKLDYYHLDICNIRHQNLNSNLDDLSDNIIEHLDSESKISVREYKNQFSKTEKSSYENIDDNYISDFCYDTIRLYNIQCKQKLNRFDFSKLKAKINASNNTPLGILIESKSGIWTSEGFEIKQYNRDDI